ncbi:MAG: ArgR family transcriptional regulator [Spirochaetota bacterium]
MNDRYDRLKTSRDIIRQKRVDSQELLLGLLEDLGHSVTQATLSRDLKYLKVGKISDGRSGYYYAVPSDEEQQESERHYVQDFMRGYVSLDWNLTTVVVRTFSGHSDSVSLAIDNMGLEEVLGTIAGRDNVVFVALRDGVTGGAFISALKRRVPELDVEG